MPVPPSKCICLIGCFSFVVHFLLVIAIKVSWPRASGGKKSEKTEKTEKTRNKQETGLL